MTEAPRMVAAGAERLIAEALAAIAAHNSDVRNRLQVRTLKQAADICSVRLVGLQREEMVALWLDEQQRLIEMQTLAMGSRREVLTDVRGVVRSALSTDARYVILAHNHPSNGARPSEPDRQFTRAMETILSAIGVRLLDHLVIGYDGRCESIAAAGGLRAAVDKAALRTN